MLSLKANPKLPGDWKERHNSAILQPGIGYKNTIDGQTKATYEYAIVRMLEAWGQYAEAVRMGWGDQPIGQDYVLGQHWRDIGLGLRGLLNGELGRLDGGTLDGFILDTLRAEGADMEGL